MNMRVEVQLLFNLPRFEVSDNLHEQTVLPSVKGPSAPSACEAGWVQT
jgi:hypothetical protein